MIKVLVVEDSPVVRDFLVYFLNRDPEIEVIGTAQNGEEAVAFVHTLQPDIITMDINMPNMNGFEATRRIMETRPVPILIVSGSWNTTEVATTFRALEAGALAVLPRPAGMGHADHEKTVNDLIQTVKLMSEVRVVRRWPRKTDNTRECLFPRERSSPRQGEEDIQSWDIQVVAMGASTGGPIALKTILSCLEKDFPLPLLIVQHIAPGFMPGFVSWLSQSSGFPVHIAEQHMLIRPGQVYFAPDYFHMGVKEKGYISLYQDTEKQGICPSVSFLFHSIASTYGPNAVGVLLTGMGKDGAEELKMMKNQGAVTFAQNQESSVVFGMPGEAIRLEAVDYVLPPEKIASTLGQLVGKSRIQT